MPMHFEGAAGWVPEYPLRAVEYCPREDLLLKILGLVFKHSPKIPTIQNASVILLISLSMFWGCHEFDKTSCRLRLGGKKALPFSTAASAAKERAPLGLHLAPGFLLTEPNSSISHLFNLSSHTQASISAAM